MLFSVILKKKVISLFDWFLTLLNHNGLLFMLLEGLFSAILKNVPFCHFYHFSKNIDSFTF